MRKPTAAGTAGPATSARENHHGTAAWQALPAAATNGIKARQAIRKKATATARRRTKISFTSFVSSASASADAIAAAMHAARATQRPPRSSSAADGATK